MTLVTKGNLLHGYIPGTTWLTMPVMKDSFHMASQILTSFSSNASLALRRRWASGHETLLRQFVASILERKEKMIYGVNEAIDANRMFLDLLRKIA